MLTPKKMIGVINIEKSFVANLASLTNGRTCTYGLVLTSL